VITSASFEKSRLKNNLRRRRRWRRRKRRIRKKKKSPLCLFPAGKPTDTFKLLGGYHWV